MKSSCLVWFAAGTLLAVVGATATPDEQSALREKTSIQSRNGADAITGRVASK
jgi:hypothetical protein